MNEQTRIHLTNLQNKLKEISRYSHCARLMSFDRETIAPKDALENENETLDFLYAKIFEIKKPPILTRDKEHRSALVSIDLAFHVPPQGRTVFFSVLYFHLFIPRTKVYS